MSGTSTGRCWKGRTAALKYWSPQRRWSRRPGSIWHWPEPAGCPALRPGRDNILDFVLGLLRHPIVDFVCVTASACVVKSAWPTLAWYWFVAVSRKAGRNGKPSWSHRALAMFSSTALVAGRLQVPPGVVRRGKQIAADSSQTPGPGTFAAPYCHWRLRTTWPSRWRCCKARRTDCPSWSPVGYIGSGRTLVLPSTTDWT